MNEEQILFYLKDLLKGATDWETGFRTGYAAGVAVALFLLLLLMFFGWFFFKRRPALKGLAGKTESGAYFVSARAVSELVISISKEINALDIRKIRLLKDGKLCRIEIVADYRCADQTAPLPENIKKLQDRTGDALSKTLGIENISTITVTILQAKL